MDINKAIKKIVEIGIDAELTSESEQRPMIIGGKANKTGLGFNIYAPSFSLEFNDNCWILTTPGPGQLDTVEKFEALDLAIKRICVLFLTDKKQSDHP